MVGLLIYVKKHCIRPEKIGKDTNQLIFQIQLILRMANDQDQVLVFNVVGGGTGVHVSPGYVQSAAQRCGRKVPGYYMYSTQRGGYTTSLLVPHWWCLVCTSSVTHSHSDTVDCRGITHQEHIRGNKGKIYVFKPCTTPKIGHKCPSWRVVVCTVHMYM